MGSHRVRHDWSDLVVVVGSILKSKDLTLPTKARLVKAMVFPVVMYGCESWTIKKAEYQRINSSELLEKTLESPLNCKEIQPVHPKGDQSWVFIGRTDAEAETPVLWPPDAKSWLIWKDPDAGKDWGQEEKGMTEDEVVGWYHQLNGHEWGWTPGVGDGQGGLACYGSGGHRVGRNWATELNWTVSFSYDFINLWELSCFLVEDDPSYLVYFYTKPRLKCFSKDP